MIGSIASMTGFASVEGTINGNAWRWELRSVNGRGLELRLRLPTGFEALEPGIRERAASSLKRGNITANLTVKRLEAARVTADRETLAQVMQLALDLARQIPGAPPPRAEALLALPGVLREATPQDTGQLALLDTARDGFAAALTQLAEARRAEGARLAAMLSEQLAAIGGLHAEAIEEAAGQPERHRARLSEALSALLRDTPGLPEDRIAHEVALLATKSDVREELDRLASHLEAAANLLREGANIGRKFDFLVQEFNREVNTLCSKSASIQLTAIGLKLKSAVEQLREQVQNIE
jgi:uncharacterized protein (TIGR00255 family)